jgi:hypothetical protein
LLQTGFNQAPAAQVQGGGLRPIQPAAPASIPMMPQQGQPVQMQPGYADPMARTSIHAPPSIAIPPMPMQPGMMLQPAAGTPPTPMAMQPQPPGFAYGGPQQAQPTGGVAMMQQQPQQQQAAGGNPLHMMRVEKPHGGQAHAQAHPASAGAAKTRPLPGAPRPNGAAGGHANAGSHAGSHAASHAGASTGSSAGTRAAPRLQPRAAPLPTPNAGGKKRMMYVGLFVFVALGLGAVVAKIVLKLF